MERPDLDVGGNVYDRIVGAQISLSGVEAVSCGHVRRHGAIGCGSSGAWTQAVWYRGDEKEDGPFVGGTSRLLVRSGGRTLCGKSKARLQSGKSKSI